jgi:nitric oxide synthase oxygenase domain/subunit
MPIDPKVFYSAVRSSISLLPDIWTYKGTDYEGIATPIYKGMTLEIEGISYELSLSIYYMQTDVPEIAPQDLVTVKGTVYRVLRIVLDPDDIGTRLDLIEVSK